MTCQRDASTRGGRASVHPRICSATTSARARGLACRRRPCPCSLRSHSPARGGRALRGGASPSNPVSLPRQRALGRRSAPFTAQRAAHGSRSRRRPTARAAPAPGKITLRLFPSACRRSSCRQPDARTTRLRETDGNGLLCRPRPVLPLANVLHFLAHELARLCRRRLALPRVSPGSSYRCTIWHAAPPLDVILHSTVLTLAHGRVQTTPRLAWRGPTRDDAHGFLAHSCYEV
jgi:hypothetical protein